MIDTYLIVTIGLAILAFDVWILSVFSKFKKNNFSVSDLSEQLLSERKYLDDLRRYIEEDLRNADRTIKKSISEMKSVVTEFEIERKELSLQVQKEIEKHISGLAERLVGPIEKVESVKTSVVNLQRKLMTQESALLKAIQKAETLTQFFDEKIAYEDLLVEIRDKKIQDTRALLSKGFTSEDISRRLNMSLSEVECIVSMT